MVSITVRLANGVAWNFMLPTPCRPSGRHRRKPAGWHDCPADHARNSRDTTEWLSAGWSAHPTQDASPTAVLPWTHPVAGSRLRADAAPLAVRCELRPVRLHQRDECVHGQGGI